MKTSSFSARLSLFLLIALLLELLSPLPAAAASAAELDPPPALSARAAVLLDARSGNLLYASNEDSHLYVAGLTVMMTALLAMEAVSRGEVALDDVVEASSTSHSDLSADASIQNIIPGECMTLSNLLACALIGSASDACNIIAEHIAGGSRSRFVAMMNDRALALGCTNTHFSNTHGLPDETHYSSAYDMARIAAAFVQYDELMDICNLTSMDVPATNVAGGRHLNNPNYILRPDYTRYYYSYANGIKSSYTIDSGYCLATAVKTDDSYVVSIVLGCRLVETESGYQDIESFTQTKKLLQWFSGNYSLRQVVNSIAPVVEVPVLLGEGMDTVAACSSTDLSLFLPNNVDLDQEYQRSFLIYSQQPGADPLLAPVAQWQLLGEMTVTDRAGRNYGPFQLVANTSVPLSRVQLMKQRVCETLSASWIKWTLLGIVLVLLLYIVLVVRYNIRRSRQRAAERAARQAAEQK